MRRHSTKFPLILDMVEDKVRNRFVTALFVLILYVLFVLVLFLTFKDLDPNIQNIS